VNRVRTLADLACPELAGHCSIGAGVVCLYAIWRGSGPAEAGR